MGRVLYIHLFIPLTKFHINGNLQIEHEHEQNIQHTNKTCSRNQNHLQGTNILSVDLMSGFICRPCTYIEKMLYICLVFTMPHNNQDG